MSQRQNNLYIEKFWNIICLTNHFFKHRFPKKATVYEEMKYFFVLIITLTIHAKKKRSLGPGKSETLLTRVKSPFYRLYRAKGHVTESLSCILNWLRQINLTEKFGTLQNTKFSFLLKKKVYKIRLSVKHQLSFFENCFRFVYICAMAQRQFYMQSADSSGKNNKK